MGIVKLGLTFLFTYSTSFAIIATKNRNFKNGKKGSIDNAINYTTTSITKYFSDKYGSKFVKVLEDSSEKEIIEGCINLDQNTCTRMFNAYMRKKDSDFKDISGTCGMVATTTIVDYYGKVLDKYTVNDDIYNTFCDVSEIAVNKKYYSRKNGLENDKVNSLLNDSFIKYDSNTHLSGGRKTDMVRSKVKSELADGRITLLGLSDHYVVCNGVTSFIVKLYKNKKKKTYEYKTFNYFIICEGYGQDNGSLFPVENVANDYLYVFNGNQQVNYIKES